MGMVPGGRLAGIAAGALLKGGTKLLSVGLKGAKAGAGALTKALGHVGGELGGKAAGLSDDLGKKIADMGPMKMLTDAGEGCLKKSFRSDTLVKTAVGAVAIASLVTGASVLAYDPKTGVTAEHSVSAVMVKLDPEIEHLVLDSGTIETTPNHPFFTADRGWVDAGKLEVGEKIRTASDEPATVLGFTVEATPTPMWDITVDDAHSFFVGEAVVVVHNCGNASDGMSFDDRQLQSAMSQHGPDIGSPKASGTPQQRMDYMSALVEHVDDAATQEISGTFRGNPVIHFVNPRSGFNLMTNRDRGFISAWQLNPTQLLNVLTRGSL